MRTALRVTLTFVFKMISNVSHVISHYVLKKFNFNNILKYRKIT